MINKWGDLNMDKENEEIKATLSEAKEVKKKIKKLKQIKTNMKVKLI